MPAIVQFYFSAIVLMLPLLSCVGIGVYWARRELPFGGAGKSGHGREKGFIALEEMSTTKTIIQFYGE